MRLGPPTHLMDFSIIFQLAPEVNDKTGLRHHKFLLRLPGTVRGCYLFIRISQDQVTETRKKGIETRD